MANVEDLLKLYTKLGLTQREILHCLAFSHKVVISRSTLQRRIKYLNLEKKNNRSDTLDVACFIQEQLGKTGSLHGYRWMYKKCLSFDLNVDRETVRTLMKVFDPSGVEERRKRRLKRRSYYNYGPNFTWHMDSNDKLRPYGIFINGCIDGFSRLIVWLEASGNGKSRTTAKHFLNAVKCRGGCPRLLRTDMGVENRRCHEYQILFRRGQGNQGHSGVLAGDSRKNQRIEFFWSVLRRECLQFWMNLFKQIEEDGHFLGDFFDKNLIRFCFLHLVKRDLLEAQGIWNTHSIRKSTFTTLPCSKPVLLYSVPQLFGYEHFLCPVEPPDIDVCEADNESEDDDCCDKDIFEISTILMEENDVHPPSDPYEATTLYIWLRTEIKQLL